MEAMKVPIKEREKSSAHLKITSYQEKEDIQDFLKVFEGIVGIQKVKETELVLCLTPLLNGKARTVYTNLGPTTGSNGEKKLFWNIKTLIQKDADDNFQHLPRMKDEEPAELIAKGMKLMKRWFPSEEGVDKILDKIAVDQFVNGLPQELRIFMVSS